MLGERDHRAHATAGSATRMTQRLRAQIRTQRGSSRGRGQHLEVRSGSAADVEYHTIWCLMSGEGGAYQVSAAPVPPVRARVSRHRLEVRTGWLVVDVRHGPASFR